MQLFLHQTHHEIADFKGIFQYIIQNFENRPKPGLHIFPELFLTGYPLQDLVLKKTFIDEYLQFIELLSQWSIDHFKVSDATGLLFGGLDYHFDQWGLPSQIENAAFWLTPGNKLQKVYVKQLLPNYDFYEEKKYFTPGEQPAILDFSGKKIGVLICEDMWFSHLHEEDPVEKLKTQGEILDLVVSLNASPFHIGKGPLRENRALEIAQLLKCPFAYVNRVGGEDDLLFDGQSFVTDGNEVAQKGNLFKNDIISLTLPKFSPPKELQVRNYNSQTNSWSQIFNLRLNNESQALIPLLESELEEIKEGLLLGIKDYAQKNGMKRFSLALSGGIDSSLVLTLLKILRDEKKYPIEIEAIYMPSLFSATESYEYSYELCKNLKIKLTSLPIKFIHSTIKNAYREHFNQELIGLADENIQSRLRGALIYARSNAVASLVLNTSNKSEIAVGYSTQYGDSVGAISPLGDLYKTEVYALAAYLNNKYGQLIPEGIITRPPSAELREGQTDEQSLPPYERLDPILEGLLSGRMSLQDLVKKGHKSEEVTKVYQLLKNSEYKRRQFCPIIKVKPKSFGFGYRVPISKKFL